MKKANLGNSNSFQKILFVVHDFPPNWFAGVEIYTYHLAKSLINNGFDVHVFYPKIINDINSAQIVDSIYDGINVHELQSKGLKHILEIQSNEPEELFTNLLQRENFDLIHVHHLKDLPLSLLKIAKENELPVCLTLHDFWYICVRKHLYIQESNIVCDGPTTIDKCVNCITKFSDNRNSQERYNIYWNLLARRNQFVKKCFDEVDLIVSPSEFLAEIYNRFNFCNKNLVVSPLGLNPIKINDNKRIRSKIVFGYLGTIHELKNVELLVKSFKKVLGDAKLDIWGYGDAERVSKLIRLIETDARIEFKGPYQPGDLPNILNTIDVVVVPSMIENYPLVVREALSAKIPVIASNVGGIPEIVENNESGFLFKSNNSHELKEILQRIVYNPEVLLELKHKIRPIKTVQEDALEWIERYNQSIIKNNSKKCTSIRLKKTADRTTYN